MKRLYQFAMVAPFVAWAVACSSSSASPTNYTCTSAVGTCRGMTSPNDAGSTTACFAGEVVNSSYSCAIGASCCVKGDAGTSGDTCTPASGKCTAIQVKCGPSYAVNPNLSCGTQIGTKCCALVDAGGSTPCEAAGYTCVPVNADCLTGTTPSQTPACGGLGAYCCVPLVPDGGSGGAGGTGAGGTSAGGAGGTSAGGVGGAGGH